MKLPVANILARQVAEQADTIRELESRISFLEIGLSITQANARMLKNALEQMVRFPNDRQSLQDARSALNKVAHS
jgi:uncharacterized coiled-coil protein SlyX